MHRDYPAVLGGIQAHPLGPLAPLAECPQWLPVLLIPEANGKTRKLPTDWRTGSPCDAHGSQFWTTYTQACGSAAQWGPAYTVGFVITRDDPWVCLDIDNALQADDTWSQLAQKLCAALPGAVLEVSQSGRGLHAWCRYPSPPPHRCKRIDLGIELYHEARFIAIGTRQTGTLADRCDALPALIERYFTPQPTTAQDVPDDGPRADWCGPTDDEELLRRAMRSKSTASRFGAGGASFADLWNAAADALGRAYPPDASSTEHFDRSSADAALASHLAFWSGCHIERIERLMRRSGLAREKYERSDYLPRTITNACAAQREVLQDKLTEAGPTITLDDARKSLHGLTTTEASEVWLSKALQLSRTDVDQFLDAAQQHTLIGRQALKATLREARKAQDAARSAAALAARAQGRKQIEHLPESCTVQAAQVEAEIVASATPGEYVSFGNVLSHVVTKELPFTHMVDHVEESPPAVPLIEPLGKVQMLAQVERVAQFYEMRRDGGRKAIAVPQPILEVLLGKRTHACPVVNGLVTHPLVLRNGEILQGQGLHRESGLYLLGADGQGMRPFTQAEAAQALQWLRVVFLEGFEFAAPLDADVALAGLFTGVQRRILDSAPGLAALANTQSSGKTTLQRRTHLMLTARDMPASTFALGNEAEVSKALLAMLLRGPAMVCFDNVPDGFTFKSGALAAAMTSSLMEQRVLGGSKDATVPTNVLFALTGNNLSLGNDEVTRWLVVRLAPIKARPETRVFRHADVVAHALSIRSEVLRMVAGVVAGYLASGHSMHTASRFPAWDRMVRQAIVWAGGHDVANVFKANADDSEPVRAHRAIVAKLLEKFGADEFSATEAASAASLVPDLREGLEALGAANPYSSKSVGRILAAKQGAAVEVDGVSYRIKRVPDRKDIGRYTVTTL